MTVARTLPGTDPTATGVPAPATPSQSTTPSTSRARPQLRTEVIERLFLRLGALYGNKFSEAFSVMPMASLSQLWAEELAGYSLDELNRGINGCRALKWPPTLPEFMALCRPPLQPEEAYHEALAKLALREQGRDCAWSHPAVYHAAMDISAFDLRRLPWTALKGRWCAALERHLSNPNCPAVPPVPPALQAPTTRGPNAQEAAALALFRQRWTGGKKPLTSFRVGGCTADPLAPENAP